MHARGQKAVRCQSRSSQPPRCMFTEHSRVRCGRRARTPQRHVAQNRTFRVADTQRDRDTEREGKIHANKPAMKNKSAPYPRRRSVATGRRRAHQSHHAQQHAMHAVCCDCTPPLLPPAAPGDSARPTPRYHKARCRESPHIDGCGRAVVSAKLTLPPACWRPYISGPSSALHSHPTGNDARLTSHLRGGMAGVSAALHSGRPDYYGHA